MERTIFHIDMNSYFASIEQTANPSLKGKPVAVCGTGRTVIVTASYEARKYGVKTGMTIPLAKKLCPGLILVIGNHEKYIDTSFKIHKIFLEFTDRVEVFSIDECFLDVTHLVKNDSDPIAIANTIKKKLKDKLSLTCSIGIGPNKLVAKVASKMQKPDGLVRIKENEVPEVFSKLPVSELQGIGIGENTSRKLKEIGINTAGDLARASIDMLTGYFGVMGYFLKRAGKGEDSSEVKKYLYQEQAKSMGHSYTLPQDTSDINTIKSYLRLLCEKTGKRLREEKMKGRVIHMYVRYSDFTYSAKQHALKSYINTGYEIFFNSYKIFECFLPLKKNVRLLGVSISELISDIKQNFLFEDISKYYRIAEVSDEINEKYGEFTVKPASILLAQYSGTQNRCGLIGKYYFKEKS